MLNITTRITKAHPLTLSKLILFEHPNNILRGDRIVTYLMEARTMESDKTAIAM
jgi:hypothetical protein